MKFNGHWNWVEVLQKTNCDGKCKNISLVQKSICDFGKAVTRVSVQGVKSLGGHFACLCQGFDFYDVKKKDVIIFQKEKGNTFTLLIISKRAK